MVSKIFYFDLWFVKQFLWFGVTGDLNFSNVGHFLRQCFCVVRPLVSELFVVLNFVWIILDCSYVFKTTKTALRVMD